MNKLAIVTLSAGLAAFAQAGDTNTYAIGKGRIHPKLAAVTMERSGGFIERGDSFKGKVVVVDERAQPDTRQLFKSAEAFCQKEKFNVVVLAQKPDAKKCPKAKLAALGAQVGVFVVERPSEPALLVAPEEGWAVVNVTPLVAGVEKSRLAPLRIQKEVLRALGFVGGGMSTQFASSLAGPVVKPEDLDLLGDVQLPFDVISSFKDYLERFGVTPYKRVTYDRACREGWAPAPTNEAQKVIWEKCKAEANTKPSNPMKITKPETKK